MRFKADLANAIGDLHRQIRENRAQISKAAELEEQDKILEAICYQSSKPNSSHHEIAKRHLSAYLEFDLQQVKSFVSNFLAYTQNPVDWRDKLFEMMREYFISYPDLKRDFYIAFQNNQGDCLPPEGLPVDAPESSSSKDYTKLLFGNAPLKTNISNESVIRCYNHQFLAVLREVILTHGVNPFRTAEDLRQLETSKLLKLQKSLYAWKASIVELKSLYKDRTLDVAHRLEMLYSRVNYEVIRRQFLALKSKDPTYDPEIIKKVFFEFLGAHSYHAASSDTKYQTFYEAFTSNVKEVAIQLADLPHTERDLILKSISTIGLENLRYANEDYRKNAGRFYAQSEMEEINIKCERLEKQLKSIIHFHTYNFQQAATNYFKNTQFLLNRAQRVSLMQVLVEQDAVVELIHFASNSIRLFDAENKYVRLSSETIESFQKAREKMAELFSDLLVEIRANPECLGLLTDETITTLIALCENHDLQEESLRGLGILYETLSARKTCSKELEV